MHVFLLSPYTITFVGLNVDLSSFRSNKKFTSASSSAYISAHLYIYKMIGLTKSCLYLKPWNSFQWIALRHIRHISSIGYNGIIRQYLRIVWYFTDEICWSNTSIGIDKRKFWACASWREPKIAFFSSCGHVKLHFDILNNYTENSTS